MLTEVATVPSHISLADATADHFLRTGYGGYPVVRGDNVVGLICLRDILRVSPEERKGTSVQAVMTPLADPIVIDAKAPLLEAMARMASGAGRLLVMQDGKMLGFLTLTSVIRHLRVRGQPALLRGSRRGRSRARGNRVGSTLRTAPPAPCPPRRCRE